MVIVVIFLGVAFYVYNTYIAPRINPDFVPNREFDDDDGRPGIAELYLFAVDWCPYSKKAKPIWNTVKKLRPEIDRQTRLQLVLKALLTIGDLPDQMQAAMVVGVCAELDKSDVDNVEANSETKDPSRVDTSTGRKVVRRSSAK